MSDRTPRNAWVIAAIVSAVFASVFEIGMQVLTIWSIRPPDAITLVAYANPEAQYDEIYGSTVQWFVAAGVVHAVPSVVAMVIAVIALRRARTTRGAVALGVGVLNVVLAAVGFALIPFIADSTALAVMSY